METEHSEFWAAVRVDVGLDDVAWAPAGGDERFSLEQTSRATCIYDHYDHLQKLLHADDLPTRKRDHVFVGSDLGAMGWANQLPELLKAQKPREFRSQGLKRTERHGTPNRIP